MSRTDYSRPEIEVLDFGMNGVICATSPAGIDSIGGENPTDSGSVIEFE